MQRRYFLTSLTALSLLHLGLGATEALTKEKFDKSHMALTIYNQNFGVVRDQRKVPIQANPALVEFDNVAQQILPTSVRFRFLTDQEAVVLEQYYGYDLVSMDKLLERYINKPITVSLKEGSHYTGELLRFDGAQLTILQKGEITVIPRENNVKDIHFSPLSEEFFSTPSLVWNLATDKLGDQWVEASYQTGGLNWQADYNAFLYDDETKMDIQAWVTLYNESGATYKNAKLKLIAGEVKRNVQPIAMMATNNAYAKRGGFQEESFFEYHSYTLDRPTTIVNNQTKQMGLFEAYHVPVKKLFVYEGAPHVYVRPEPITEANFGTEEGNKKVQVMVEFHNRVTDHLGMPLPQGTVRLYQEDPADHVPEFIGEDTLSHTSKDEKVRLNVGSAFDVVGRRQRMDFQLDLAQRVMVEKFEIELKNHRDSAIEVLVKEPLYRWISWEVVSSSLPFKKKDAKTIEFLVPLEKNSQQTLTYTVRYSW